MERTGGSWIPNLVRNAALALSALAIVRELRKPAEQREWHGTVGPVPYDFRRPTLDRVRQRMWSPDGPLISPQPFGVGWTINLGGLVSRFRARTE